MSLYTGIDSRVQKQNVENRHCFVTLKEWRGRGESGQEKIERMSAAWQSGKIDPLDYQGHMLKTK